jgi:phosphotriesterase-related protein
MSAVRTVLQDVPAAQLGMTYAHEHLILDSAVIAKQFSHIHLPSADDAATEAAFCAAAGVGTMVDAMPIGGRAVLRLAEVSRRSGVRIVAATGLHTSKYYAHLPWTQEASEQQLADLFTADIRAGIDEFDHAGATVRRTTHRAGIVKVATAGDTPTQAERRTFGAAVETVRRTGVPLLTHCEGGRGALAQVELLAELGMPLSRVVLSHTDKVLDRGYHREVLGSGVNVEYDQAVRHADDAHAPTARLVAAMICEGFLDQLLLGTDGARRTLWRALGGEPGLAWLASQFPPVLAALGVDAAAQHALYVTNPARILALEATQEGA